MGDRPSEDANTATEAEIRKGRTFTPQEAIARLAGPGAMSGASPVPPHEQAENAIWTALRGRVVDPAGALQTVLHRQLRGSELLIRNIDQPLVALTAHLKRLLESDYLLTELVRDTDAEWARMMGERAYFETAGKAQHPDDPYTLRSVRSTLSDAFQQMTEASSL